jgi:hypothetical protein
LLRRQIREVYAGLLVGVIVAMAPAAAVTADDRQQRPGGAAHKIVSHSLDRIYLVGHRGLDAALRHGQDEMGRKAGREKHVDTIDRVGAGTARFVDGLFRRQVEPAAFRRRSVGGTS